LRIWVDFTNSPHVLVLRPMVEIFRAQGHDVKLTARDFAQTLELLDRFGLEHATVGKHRGARRLDKALGLFSRSISLARWARTKRFDLAIGHGSNDVTVAAKLLRVPSVTMFDYEFAKAQHNVNCRLARRVIVPDAISPERLAPYGAAGKIHAYPGLKEEYYLADFEPDTSVLAELGLDAQKVIVVLRTPPELALYHRLENDLFLPLIEKLKDDESTQVVALPRTPQQRVDLLALGATNFVIPERAIDAPSLVALADVVIGAGGTMNREAVALGTPVYTTFAGRIGAVDERLLAEGRLRRLENLDEVSLVKKPPTRPTRTRRDPKLIVDLMLGAARAGSRAAA
jgi:predicted glycosyltransferase